MTETPVQHRNVPFFRSFILNRTVYLDKLGELANDELDLLNVETLATLSELRYEYEKLEDKESTTAGVLFHRIKVAGYFQAAIKVENDQS
jgi:hypothetical protein